MGRMHLVSQRVVHFAQKLGSQPLEDDFGRNAIDEKLVQLSSNQIQHLGSLLLQAIADNFLQCIRWSKNLEMMETSSAVRLMMRVTPEAFVTLHGNLQGFVRMPNNIPTHPPTHPPTKGRKHIAAPSLPANTQDCFTRSVSVQVCMRR